jgi:hypothetical protein
MFPRQTLCHKCGEFHTLVCESGPFGRETLWAEHGAAFVALAVANARVDALEAKLASRDTELIEAVARDLREAVGLLTTVTGYRDSDEATDQDWYAACDAIDAFLARPNIAALRPAGETTGSEGK